MLIAQTFLIIFSFIILGLAILELCIFYSVNRYLIFKKINIVNKSLFLDVFLNSVGFITIGIGSYFYILTKNDNLWLIYLIISLFVEICFVAIVIIRNILILCKFNKFKCSSEDFVNIDLKSIAEKIKLTGYHNNIELTKKWTNKKWFKNLNNKYDQLKKEVDNFNNEKNSYEIIISEIILFQESNAFISIKKNYYVACLTLQLLELIQK